MKIFILGCVDRLKQWTLKWALSPHAAFALFAIAFAESSFFPIPPDVLLLAILMVSAERWIYYATLTTVGSVLGSLLGYAIGWAFYATVGQYIVNTYHLQSLVAGVGKQYADHAFLTIFTAAFTPIPYKLITIAAGLFKISLVTLIVASIIGRAARFFLVAGAVRIFGKKVNVFIKKYFDILSILFVILLVGGFFVVKWLF